MPSSTLVLHPPVSEISWILYQLSGEKRREEAFRLKKQVHLHGRLYMEDYMFYCSAWLGLWYNSVARPMAQICLDFSSNIYVYIYIFALMICWYRTDLYLYIQHCFTPLNILCLSLSCTTAYCLYVFYCLVIINSFLLYRACCSWKMFSQDSSFLYHLILYSSLSGLNERPKMLYMVSHRTPPCIAKLKMCWILVWNNPII